MIGIDGCRIVHPVSRRQIEERRSRIHESQASFVDGRCRGTQAIDASGGYEEPTRKKQRRNLGVGSLGDADRRSELSMGGFRVRWAMLAGE